MGSVIINALKTTLASRPNVQLLSDTTAESLQTDHAGSVTGVKVTDATGTARVLPAGAVVLTSGGFGASREMLARYAPHAASFATTSGSQATGEGIGLATAVGARLVDMDKVQIHPTGLVNPKDPAAMTKFLAPEKLRGVGGVLLSPEGRRYVNELTTRDLVSEATLR